MSSGKVKPQQLWGKSKDDLRKQLAELKTELGQLRTQKIAGGASSKLNKMYVTHLQTHTLYPPPQSESTHALSTTIGASPQHTQSTHRHRRYSTARNDAFTQNHNHFQPLTHTHTHTHKPSLTNHPFLPPKNSHDIRKSIARVLTIINTTQRQQLRLFYAKKKYQPLDLRAKKTRALRREMTKGEKAKITEKEKKKRMHFPERKFAVKAEV
ncbi:MAG: 60S ribosomal protein L35 [Alyxoria varia]|nr:MAG: 60S ribosomal protein L35 [Alyxoria varia]